MGGFGTPFCFHSGNNSHLGVLCRRIQLLGCVPPIRARICRLRLRALSPRAGSSRGAIGPQFCELTLSSPCCNLSRLNVPTLTVHRGHALEISCVNRPARGLLLSDDLRSSPFSSLRYRPVMPDDEKLPPATRNNVETGLQAQGLARARPKLQRCDLGADAGYSGFSCRQVVAIISTHALVLPHATRRAKTRADGAGLDGLERSNEN